MIAPSPFSGGQFPRALFLTFAPLRGANARVARLRQAARLARTALRREPVVRPDFLPRQSGVTRPLPGQKVGQLARYAIETIMKDIYLKLRPLTGTPKEELCNCKEIKEIYLAYKLGTNPVHCLQCNGEIPPEKLGYDIKTAESIASWNTVYGALYVLWLNSGEYEGWARERLLDRQGQVNKEGFELINSLDPFAKAYYLWFHENCDETEPSECPLCSAPLQPRKQRRFLLCEHCRILI